MPERFAVVRVFVHVEDTDAPGYFVDIESEPVEVISTSGQTSTEQFAKAIGAEAHVRAIEVARRLYDPDDPEYGRNR